MRLTLHRPNHTEPWGFAAVRDDTVTVALPKRVVQTWDCAGRWLGGTRGGWQWRRSYDGKLAGAPTGQPLLGCTGQAQALGVHQESLNDARQLHQDLSIGALRLEPDETAGRATLLSVLERAIHWNLQQAQLDAIAFTRLYRGGIAVLPEDLRRALYLQLSEGCAWNRCQYCTLYADLPHRSPTISQLRQQVESVIAWHGASMGLRRSLFLGDADILGEGPSYLLAQFQLLAEFFALPAPAKPQGTTSAGLYPLDAADGFATARSILACKPAELEALQAHGLRRLYIGVETGHPPLHHAMHRRDPLTALPGATKLCHDAGLQVALTVIVGLGGQHYAGGHLRDTTELLERLNLRRGDQVSLSPLVIEDGSPYAQAAQQRNEIGFLPDELAREVRRFHDTLSQALGPGPRVAPYQIGMSPW